MYLSQSSQHSDPGALSQKAFPTFSSMQPQCSSTGPPSPSIQQQKNSSNTELQQGTLDLPDIKPIKHASTFPLTTQSLSSPSSHSPKSAAFKHSKSQYFAASSNSPSSSHHHQLVSSILSTLFPSSGSSSTSQSNSSSRSSFSIKSILRSKMKPEDQPTNSFNVKPKTSPTSPKSSRSSRLSLSGSQAFFRSLSPSRLSGSSRSRSRSPSRSQLPMGPSLANAVVDGTDNSLASNFEYQETPKRFLSKELRSRTEPITFMFSRRPTVRKKGKKVRHLSLPGNNAPSIDGAANNQTSNSFPSTENAGHFPAAATSNDNKAGTTIATTTNPQCPHLPQNELQPPASNLHTTGEHANDFSAPVSFTNPFPSPTTPTIMTTNELNHQQPLIHLQDATLCLPSVLQKGIPMFRVTHKKKTLRNIQVQPINDTFVLSWDEKASSKFDIDDITGIHVGNKACYYQNELYKGNIIPDEYNRWITIIYTGTSKKKIRELHVVAQNENDFNLLVQTVQSLWNFRQSCDNLLELDELALKSEWDLLNMQEVPYAQIEQVLAKHDIYCSPKQLREIHKRIISSNKESFNFQEFKLLLEALNERPEISKIWEDRCDMTEPLGMSFSAFKRFCKHVQKLKLSKEEKFELFQKYSEGNDSIDARQFKNFLVSEEDNPAMTVIPQDLSFKLTDYFISSSHNTYLLDRQVFGYSSAEPYVRALLDNCRCVEIDIWDGDSEPVVSHGRTMTSDVKFQTVIMAINEYAFQESKLPLILSFEVHCSPDNQKKMVEIMKSIFKDKLVTEPLHRNSFTLPTPEELMEKILIKVKPASFTSEYKMLGQAIGEHTQEEEEDSSSDSGENGSSPVPVVEATSGISRLGIRRKSKSGAQATKDSKIIPMLGELGVYLSGTKYRGFTTAAAKKPNHCFSFNEAKINEMICASDSEDEGLEDQFINHNKRYFSRMYPHNLRITSKNYDPIPYWRRGAQMVALNWQNYDTAMQLNDAMFAGTQGWVLKPKVEETVHRRLTIDIISLVHFPKLNKLTRNVAGATSVSSTITTTTVTENSPSKNGLSVPSTSGSPNGTTKTNTVSSITQTQTITNSQFSISVELFGCVEKKDSLKTSALKYLAGSPNKGHAESVSRKDIWYSSPLTTSTIHTHTTRYNQTSISTNHFSATQSSTTSAVSGLPPVSNAPNLAHNINTTGGYHHYNNTPYTNCNCFMAHADTKGCFIDEEGNKTYTSGNQFSREVSAKDYDFAFVRFSVRDSADSGQPVALYMVRLKNLNQGYRQLPLRDLEEGEFKSAKLFVKIKLEDI